MSTNPSTSTVTNKFGQAVSTSRSLLALYITPETKEERVVQVPGTTFRDEADSYVHAETEGDHLFCLDCRVKMRFHEGKPSTGGSSGAGKNGYFAPEPGEKHGADCAIPNRRPLPKRDKRAHGGTQLVVDTIAFSDAYHTEKGVFNVSAGGRLTKAEGAKRYTNIPIANMKDMIHFLETGKKDATVLYKNEQYDFADVYIRDPEQLVGLIERAHAREGGQGPLALLYVETSAQHNPKPDYLTNNPKRKGKVPPAPIDRIHIGKLNGRNVYAQIQLYIDEQNGGNNANDSMAQPGTFLVMGEVRHFVPDYKEGSKKDMVHYLNVTVRKSGQIARVNIENIEAMARMTGPERKAIYDVQEAELKAALANRSFDPGKLTGE